MAHLVARGRLEARSTSLYHRGGCWPVLPASNGYLRHRSPRNSIDATEYASVVTYLSRNLRKVGVEHSLHEFLSKVQSISSPTFKADGDVGPYGNLITMSDPSEHAEYRIHIRRSFFLRWFPDASAEMRAEFALFGSYGFSVWDGRGIARVRK